MEKCSRRLLNELKMRRKVYNQCVEYMKSIRVAIEKVLCELR